VSDRIAGISYECGPQDRTSLNRVECGAPSTRVREVFGEPARVLCAHVAPDDPDTAAAALAPSVRAFDISFTGTRYVAIRDRIAGFIVRAPHDLESDVGRRWRPC